MKKNLQLLGTVVATLGGMLFSCSGVEPDPTDTSEAACDEEIKNPTCADLGLGEFEFKLEGELLQSGTYPIGDGVSSVTVATDGTYFDWSASLGIDAVIAKGGPGASVYQYIPEANSATGLSAPTNPNTEKPYELSHISFCYDYEVVVSKSAAPALDRTWQWSIEKTAGSTDLLLSAGQIFDVGYTVTVASTGFMDDNFRASGDITIVNPSPFVAKIESVTDTMAGASVPVDCGAAMPFYLAPGGTLTCTYAASLLDTSTRVNVATVQTTGAVGGGVGEALVDFASATITALDDCVDVDDSMHGFLGQACAAEDAVAFLYSHTVGPFEVCGLHVVENTATFTTNSSGATGSDSASVNIEVACPSGCTLTPGYWKTHSSYGPAPYDETWALLPDGADTLFFLSGQSYHEVLWTPVAGNVYYILARAWIAATLNVLNEADGSAVATALSDAEAILAAATPASLAKVKGALRAQIISLAGLLDDYNNGLIGPGHCSE
jgi:hypothetical protein